MAKKSNTYRSAPAASSPFEECRDELFQHIMRCGVVGSLPEHQEEWFADTLKYLKDRYPELSPEQLAELRTLGMRFAQPPKKQSPNDAASAA
jgi:hypothetical protein